MIFSLPRFLRVKTNKNDSRFLKNFLILKLPSFHALSRWRKKGGKMLKQGSFFNYPRPWSGLSRSHIVFTLNTDYFTKTNLTECRSPVQHASCDIFKAKIGRSFTPQSTIKERRWNGTVRFKSMNPRYHIRMYWTNFCLPTICLHQNFFEKTFL